VRDSYAGSGRWPAAGLEGRLKERAARRKLEDLSIGPILSWTTERMLGHVEAVLKIPGGLIESGQECALRVRLGTYSQPVPPRQQLLSCGLGQMADGAELHHSRQSRWTLQLAAAQCRSKDMLCVAHLQARG
jgi:hypothetical protein